MPWVCMSRNLPLINKLNGLRRLHVFAGGSCLAFVACIALFFTLIQHGHKESAAAYEKGKIAWAHVVESNVVAALVPTSKLGGAQPSEVPAPTAEGTPPTPTPDTVRLNAAPQEDLVEKTAEGLLPKIASSGTKPWIYYSRPFVNDDKLKKVALVITGLGINKTITESATALNPNFSLIFSSYSPQLDAWLTSARTQGHECLLELPLEVSHYPAVDSGPSALMTTIMPEENSKRLAHILTRTTGYIGLVAPRSEMFFAGKEEFVKPVIDELAKRGILMVFSHNDQRSVLDGLLKESPLPYLHTDVKVEYGTSAQELKSTLESLEIIAQERGHAIGVVEYSPNMAAALAAWEQDLNKRGFQLVPISVLARLNFS